MKFILRENQNKTLIDSIQKYLNNELKDLKFILDQDDDNFEPEEREEISALEKIELFDLTTEDGSKKVFVDLYISSRKVYFDVLIFHFQRKLKSFIGPNKIVIRKMIDIRKYRPGIDW